MKENKYRMHLPNCPELIEKREIIKNMKINKQKTKLKVGDIIEMDDQYFAVANAPITGETNLFKINKDLALITIKNEHDCPCIVQEHSLNSGEFRKGKWRKVGDWSDLTLNLKDEV